MAFNVPLWSTLDERTQRRLFRLATRMMMNRETFWTTMPPRMTLGEARLLECLGFMVESELFRGEGRYFSLIWSDSIGAFEPSYRLLRASADRWTVHNRAVYEEMKMAEGKAEKW